jgi:hypothetical protein
MAIPARFRNDSSRRQRFGITLLALGLAWPAAAELVVFTDGRVVKAAGHQMIGSQLEIRLPGGGSYSVDNRRIEKIVDDEVAASALPPPPAPAAKTPTAQIRPAPLNAPLLLIAPPPPAARDAARQRSGMGRAGRNRGAPEVQSSEMSAPPDE